MSLHCYFSNIFNVEKGEYENFEVNSQFFLGKTLFVRCGVCFNCRKFKALEWVSKAKFEYTQWKYAYFLTLTYNDENLPLELNTRDYQLFLKRFRIWLHRNYKEKCKYLVAGEYGSRYGRPHYHMILFCNVDLTDSFYKVSKKQFSSFFIEKMWGLGFITIAPASIETIAYTAFYSTKKLTTKQKFSFISKNSDTGLIPKSEFIYASNGFGVGYVIQNFSFFKENWYILPKSMIRESIFGKDFVDDIKEKKQYYVYLLHKDVDWKKQRNEYRSIEFSQRKLIVRKRLLNKFK